MGDIMKDNYFTVDIDIMELVKGRDDADARLIRYLVTELSTWRVNSINKVLLLDRMTKALEENGLKYVDFGDDGAPPHIEGMANVRIRQGGGGK